jgi:hypothetical protein
LLASAPAPFSSFPSVLTVPQPVKKTAIIKGSSFMFAVKNFTSISFSSWGWGRSGFKNQRFSNCV